VFTDYLARLIRFLDFAKKIVPLNDDVFDFSLQALPGYELVGDRRILLGCWGSFQNAEVCDYRYEHMNEWAGRCMSRRASSSTASSSPRA
jgi:hydrogenase large subunit